MVYEGVRSIYMCKTLTYLFTLVRLPYKYIWYTSFYIWVLDRLSFNSDKIYLMSNILYLINQIMCGW